MYMLRRHLKLVVALCFCAFMFLTVMPGAQLVTVGHATPVRDAAPAAPSAPSEAALAGVLVGLWAAATIGAFAYGFYEGYMTDPPTEARLNQTLAGSYHPMDFSSFDG